MDHDTWQMESTQKTTRPIIGLHFCFIQGGVHCHSYMPMPDKEHVQEMEFEGKEV